MQLLKFLLTSVILVFDQAFADTRYLVNRPSGTSGNPRPGSDDKSRAIYRLEDEDPIISDIKPSHDKRNPYAETSTFDPDILNKFLDEYAHKIRTTTEKSFYPVKTTRMPVATSLEIDNGSMETTMHPEQDSASTIDGLETLNDTLKRNKFYNNHPNEDKNGWVTLEAIPWSKSKISKWQANPNSQRPWPETNKWDKPSNNNNNNNKPWPTSDYNSRPHYENNKPWYDKPKPQYGLDYEPSRPKPVSRPSYHDNQYDSNGSHAQKWPPERPNWEDFSSNQHHRPHGDIITDNRPSNFPTSNWDKYDQISRPTYSPSYHDRYPEEPDNDWSNYPNKFQDEKPYSRPTRPFYTSNYNYENRHPPSHPSSGDGQWVLLSTNRGYQKPRQRSLKIETFEDITLKPNATKKEATDPAIAVITSKRQVRLTVLPSINGTNTTTSHGGLLEVEKTFKTVDQSQREYEAEKLAEQQVIKRRPIKTAIIGRQPSNSAVIAAVGAGMLPATMAMMIPMMLGRKKRSPEFQNIHKFIEKQSDNRTQNFFLSQ